MRRAVQVERTYSQDEQAVIAALRLVLESPTSQERALPINATGGNEEQEEDE